MWTALRIVVETLLNLLHQQMFTIDLIDLISESFASFILRSCHNPIRIFWVNFRGRIRHWPLPTQSVEHEDAKGKDVNRRRIFRSICQCLGWHVCWGARGFGHARKLIWSEVEDFSNPQVGNLGLHCRRE